MRQQIFDIKGISITLFPFRSQSSASVTISVTIRSARHHPVGHVNYSVFCDVDVCEVIVSNKTGSTIVDENPAIGRLSVDHGADRVRIEPLQDRAAS